MNQATQAEWEAMWAPYDEPIYREALSHIRPGTIVLDIGAGDLRFARLAASRAGFVYAVERRPELVGAALTTDLPANIEVICADARTVAFPDDVDTAILLMRHCIHFDLYVRKLEAIGCRYLITNARWGMGVELIDLNQSPSPLSKRRPAGLPVAAEEPVFVKGCRIN
ncbi:MAG: class I SAM-dependent methyltransferase [Chloroflexota bacterium]